MQTSKARAKRLDPFIRAALVWKELMGAGTGVNSTKTQVKLEQEKEWSPQVQKPGRNPSRIECRSLRKGPADVQALCPCSLDK